MDDPRTVFAELTAKSEIIAIQAGEAGPIAGAIAGVDIALWDLAARRAGQPLWRYLGGASPQIRVYGSGLNPDDPGQIAKAHLALGYRAFKLKVGFGEARDLGNLADLRAILPSGGELMVDANQAWDLETALHMAERMAPFNLHWLEEPLRADRPWSEWQQLAKRSAIPLAAGENLAGEAQFEAALAAGPRRWCNRIWPSGEASPACSRSRKNPGSGSVLLSALPGRRHRPARFSAPASGGRRRGRGA